MNGISLIACIVDGCLFLILVLCILALIHSTFFSRLFSPTLLADLAVSQAAGGQLSTTTSTNQIQLPETSAARNVFIIKIFGDNEDNNKKPESKDDDPCAICLCRCRADLPEKWRVLPRCKHGFHLHCILKWLETNESCPVCRDSVSVI